MIIKQVDSKTKDLEVLEQLLQMPDLTQQVRQNIEQKIRLIRAGIKGEAESAYQLQFHFGNHPDWVIIHDLRLQYQSKVAQIDHILINRQLQIFVCESKRIAGGLIINEQGEFSRMYKGKGQGIPSPLEQNQRHISILNKLLQTNQIQLPSRFGWQLRPSIHSLILVSNEAYIRRPKISVPELDRVIKNEQLKTKVHQLSKHLGIFSFIRTVPRASLQKFARQLAQQHRPAQYDWHGYFGLNHLARKIDQPATESQTQTENQSKTASHYFCISCHKNITASVAYYCWNHKNIFGGKAYCYQCQQKIKQQQQ
ncbi:nuclease-related domain-containing protein [Snodgrassella communis]|jgi:hypothetical protein|uniref:nuclease-related domain-containing protein n=1 Tax=Snodgrassella communis TaxID=2946699 RepID=UPI000C1F8674|nr:nuclease-related domain-containing protein [Snodgrassella communis]PIT22196.1 hypothetical protein BGI35_05025 [Snodgrassella communis]